MHLCCCKWHYFILFHGWVIVLCIYISTSLHPVSKIAKINGFTLNQLVSFADSLKTRQNGRALLPGINPSNCPPASNCWALLIAPSPHIWEALGALEMAVCPQGTLWVLTALSSPSSLLPSLSPGWSSELRMLYFQPAFHLPAQL